MQLTEDCLVLQIVVPLSVDLFDPNNPPDERLPVMFWIHGGFFFRGAGTSFKLDAHSMLSDATNAIVVKVNYRVGKQMLKNDIIQLINLSARIKKKIGEEKFTSNKTKCLASTMFQYKEQISNCRYQI